MTETKDHADLVERLCDSVDLLRNFPTRPVPGKLSPVDGRHLDVIQREIEEAAQALTTQAARIAELEGALKPFAEAAKDADCPEVPDGSDAWESSLSSCVSYGDFRRAYAALEPKP